MKHLMADEGSICEKRKCRCRFLDHFLALSKSNSQTTFLNIYSNKIFIKLTKSTNLETRDMMTITSRLFCYRTSIRTSSYHKEAINVKWEKPQIGWTKLNYDGSCKCETGKCSIGGVFRDENAGFVLGYAQSIGQSTSAVAELAALVRGLEIALENGWTRVCLEGDWKSLVDIIGRKREVKCVQMRRHVERVNLIIPQLEKCVLRHIYRQGNRVADGFAEIGQRFEKLQIWRDDPPFEVMRIVEEDAQGKTFLRRR